MYTLAPAGALAVCVHYHGCWVSPWAHGSGAHLGLDQGYTGTQLEGLAAGECCGEGQ